MSILDIETSSVFTRIRKAGTRIIVNEGSSRSTKTYSIIQFIIDQCLASRTKVTICRKKLTWLKGTVMVDFLEILDVQYHMYSDRNWNKTESEYHFSNGSVVSFCGLDEPQKMHGRKQDIFWINEAVESDHKDFEQLIIRTTKYGILDYNPSYETHWIYDKVIPRDDCTLIHSTYKDNPYLSPAIVEEIERLEPTPENILQGTADEISWKIYGLGQRAAHKGLIFAKAQICKELPHPSTWRRSIYGIDFGYTNDPTALSQVVLSQGNLYFDEIIYKRGLTNIINPMNPKQLSIQQLMLDAEIPFNARIWADAAEPKSIADLQNCGWHELRPADKGPDSVIVGIDTLLRYNLFITERSLNAIKERNNYKWRTDSKTGELLNEPVDAWNHFWDSVRYPAYMEMRRSGNVGGIIMGHGSGHVHE